jgi:queuine tRNA-ribosyltransferase
MPFALSLTDAASGARLGSLALGHGTVSTPCFMPVGTNATVKAMRTADLETIGVNLILGNAYHLYLRPGAEVIDGAGGLHAFMGWPHNILTDSGGYQVFSLAAFRTVEEQGVAFRSHIDGSSHRLSPEDVVAFECLLGSDVLMPLDVCTAPGITRAEAEQALRLTARWLERSRASFSASCRAPTSRTFDRKARPAQSSATCRGTRLEASRWGRSSRCSRTCSTTAPLFFRSTSRAT